MEESRDGWVLLAEDDALFSVLFQRFWASHCSGVELICVATVAQGRRELAERPKPVGAVLDLNLKDGSGREISELLECPVLIWSATSEGKVVSKPRGRSELVEAVEKIGRMFGLGASGQ